MARVMFYSGVSLLVISAALLLLPICFSVFLIFLCALLFLVLLIFSKKIKVNGLKVLVFICLIFLLSGVFTLKTKVLPAENLNEYKATVIGTVVDYPLYYDNYTAYTVESESINIIYEEGNKILTDVPQNIKIRLTDVNDLDFKVFDKIEVTVIFNELGEFRTSSLGNGIYVGGYIETLENNLGENRPFYAVFYDFREYLNSLLYDNINYSDASVISAAVLGDMTRLDEDFYLNAKVAGVSHALVVSGMHLGIVFQTLSVALGILGVRKRLFSVILMLSVFSVTAICGFTPSILRAGLTYFIMAFGMFIFKKPDALNSLGLATVIILFTSPFAFWNVSLLLSLASTFGLLFFCPFFYSKICALLSRKFKPGKLVKATAFSVCQTFSATITTMPICIVYFGYISLISPIANLLIGYPVTLLLEISVFTLALLTLPSFLKFTATLPIIVICLLTRYTVFATNFLGSFDFAVVSVSEIFLIIWAVFMVLILASMKSFDIKKLTLKIKVISFASLTVVLAIITVIFANTLPKNKFAVLSVGKGQSSVLMHNDKVYVIGAGDGKNDAKVIENYLLTLGKRRIDYLILPKGNKVFSGGGAALDWEIEIDCVVAPKDGDFYTKLKHISDERYNFFEECIIITLDSEGGFIYADSTGCAINVDGKEYWILTGEESFNGLTSSGEVLVITEKLSNSGVYGDFSNIVISGEPEDAVDIKGSEKELAEANLLQNNFELEW